MPNCKFLHVEGAADCAENYSGTGNHLFVVPYENLFNEGTPKLTLDEAKNEYSLGQSATLTGYKVMMADGTGQVTSENNADGGGFNITATGRVARGVHDFAVLARTLNNLPGNYAIFVSTGNVNEYYVIWDPNREVKFTNSFDSGNSLDSEHGHTFTFVVNGAKYPEIIIKNCAITKVTVTSSSSN